eukprot:753162-Hanusia_phi.AAC.1
MLSVWQRTAELGARDPEDSDRTALNFRDTQPLGPQPYFKLNNRTVPECERSCHDTPRPLFESRPPGSTRDR